MDRTKPYLINLLKIGEPSLGYISVAEKNNLPFKPKRIYWTYYTPENVERGGHAHYELEQIMVAVAGQIKVNIEMADGYKEIFILDSPDSGLVFPAMCWHTMTYSEGAVQLCIASHEYSEEDYIRDYDTFKVISKNTGH